MAEGRKQFRPSFGIGACVSVGSAPREEQVSRSLRQEEEEGVKHVDIYTDGACRGNPGRGGWGAILVYGGHERELSGGEPSTTNNRMELTAAIEGLRALREDCEVDLYSDSKYLVDAVSLGWAQGWRARGWRRSGGEAKNPELWEQLLSLLERHRVTMHWVRGHDGHAYNERCDALATAAADRFAPAAPEQGAAE